MNSLNPTLAPNQILDCCFPSVATVKVGNAESVTMSELQIGDRVKTSINKFIAD